MKLVLIRSTGDRPMWPSEQIVRSGSFRMPKKRINESEGNVDIYFYAKYFSG